MSDEKSANLMIEKRLVAALPFASWEAATVGGYRRTARQFVAHCAAKQYEVVPPSWQAVAHFLLSKFMEGRTTRSNASIVSKIKWYYVTVLQQKWLGEVGIRTLQQARRALAKHEFSIVRKSKPLYGWMLRAVWERGWVKGEDQKAIFALWVLAYAIMARFGEVLGKAAVQLKQLALLGEGGGGSLLAARDSACG